MIYKDDDIIRSKNATALLNTMENEWGNYTINIEENLNSDLSDKLQIEEGKIRAISAAKNEHITRVNNILFNHRIDIIKIKHKLKNHFESKKHYIDNKTNETFQRIIEKAYKKANEDKSRLIEQIRRYYYLILSPLKTRMLELQGNEISDETGRTEEIRKLEAGIPGGSAIDTYWGKAKQANLEKLRELINYDLAICAKSRSAPDCSHLSILEKNIESFFSVGLEGKEDVSATTFLNTSSTRMKTKQLSEGSITTVINTFAEGQIGQFQNKLDKDLQDIIRNLSHHLILKSEIKWASGRYIPLTSLRYNKQGGEDYYIESPPLETEFHLKIITPKSTSLTITTPLSSAPNNVVSGGYTRPKLEPKLVKAWKDNPKCVPPPPPWPSSASAAVSAAAAAARLAMFVATLKNCARYVRATTGNMEKIGKNDWETPSEANPAAANVIFQNLQTLEWSNLKGASLSLGENRFMLTLHRSAAVGSPASTEIYNLIITVPPVCTQDDDKLVCGDHIV